MKIIVKHCFVNKVTIGEGELGKLRRQSFIYVQLHTYELKQICVFFRSLCYSY